MANDVKYLSYDGLAHLVDKIKIHAIAESITYDELVVKRNNSALQFGKYYMITDYVTLLNNDEKYMSIEEGFAIIVLATSENTLSEEAFAYDINEGYFKDNNANLNAWKLWYCLDNDTNRFEWAFEGGKGVIYRMIDEHGNDCPYDFKNIKFRRFELSAPVTSDSEPCLTQLSTNIIYQFDNNILSYIYGGVSTDIIDGSHPWEAEYGEVRSNMTGNSKLFFTFSYITSIDTDDIKDLSIINTSNCKNNVIKEYYGAFSNTKTLHLNDIVFFNTTNARNCHSNVFGTKCSLNSFGDACNNNSFGNECSRNSFANVCINNSFGNTCACNSFGSYCTNNSFGNNNSSNSFMHTCYDNTFDDEIYSNSFGHECNNNRFTSYISGNRFGNTCTSNSFGNEYYSNTFGNECRNNSFGNGCYYNTFGDNCAGNSFGNECYENSFGNMCSNNSFGNKCYSNTFGDGCNHNSLGNCCGGNHLGSRCCGNKFGNEYYSNTFGNECRNNSFGNGCYYNTFGDNCAGNSSGNECWGNRLGACSGANSFADSCKYNIFSLAANTSASLRNYCIYNRFDTGCSYNIIWNDTTANAKNKLQNIHVKRGVSGTSGVYNMINIQSLNNTYCTSVAKTSSNELLIYCEEDYMSNAEIDAIF